MRRLSVTDVPVPTVYCLCEDESEIGRTFYVMECMQSHVLWDQLLPVVSNAERAAQNNDLNRVSSALQTVKFAGHGLAEHGKPVNYFERQIGR